MTAAASASTGVALEGVVAAPTSAGLVALGGIIGAAGAALAGRSRGTGARHSRCVGLAAAEESAPEAATPKEEPAAPKKEEPKVEPKAEPAPAEEAKAPAPPAPASPPAPATPPPAEKKAPVETGFVWSKQIGVTEPLGFWDPAGFSKGKDEDDFKKYRTAELKHGRVAMMAALGAVTQHFITFPGFDDVPRGMGAPFSILGGLGFIGLLGASYVLETDVWKQDPKKEIGDFGDPLNLNQYTEEMRNKEINNGRFAMFAAIGIILAENETGKDAIEQIFGI